MEEQHSHHSILKATGIFGFVQLLKMVVFAVSSKLVALFLGPIGMGLVALLQNVLQIILALTSFEFLKTATREIAIKKETTFATTVNLLFQLAIGIGVLGGLVSVLFGLFFNKIIFTTSLPFSWYWLLILYFVFTSISNVYVAILQGVNQIKTLAIFNLAVSFFTALGSVPLYYFFRTEGVIWVVIYGALVQLVLAYLFTRNYTWQFNVLSLKELKIMASPLMQLGFFMSINLIFGQICFLLIKLFLTQTFHSTAIVGLYEVGNVILVNYLGLVFQAMSYDFYPKLSMINHDNDAVKKLVNKQMEIAIILITPAVLLLYLMGPLVLELLYSKAFLPAFSILKFALLSVILKAITMPLGYIILAKGNKKQFFKQELLGDFLNVTLSILFYNYFGLEGLGLAYVLHYAIYALYVYFVVNKSYAFEFESALKKLIIVNVNLGMGVALALCFLPQYHYFVGVLVVFSVVYSYRALQQRVDLKKLFKK